MKRVLHLFKTKEALEIAIKEFTTNTFEDFIYRIADKEITLANGSTILYRTMEYPEILRGCTFDQVHFYEDMDSSIVNEVNAFNLRR